MADILNKAIGIGIALVLLFVMAGALIMPQFNNVYNVAVCRNATWVANTTYYNSTCTDYSDTTPATAPITNATFESDCGYETCCKACSDWGVQTTYRGLVLLIFVIGIIAFAIWFLGKTSLSR